MTTCKRCGWCCEHIMVRMNVHKLPLITVNDREWMRARDIDVVKMEDGTVQMIIPSICEKLTYETNKDGIIAICTVQENKPYVCRQGTCPLPRTS